MNDKELMAILRFKDEMSKTVKDVNKNLKEMRSAQNEVEKANRSMADTIKVNSKAMLKAGSAMTVAFGAIAFNAVKDAISFESAFTGIVKTVDGTKEQIDKLRTSILQMTTEIPKSAEELSKIGEIGGQLNVPIQNMEKFIKTVAQLTDSTDISLEEGTLQIAQFMNVMKESMDNIDRVGSSITYLGNNSATTESKILSMASRIARSSKMIGLSSADVLGFSTAISSTGIEAEMGGSAFSKFAINMQNAVSSGSEEMAKYAELAGTTTKKFKELFKLNPAKAMAGVLTGIGTSGDPYAVLADLDIKEVRLRETVLALAGSHQELNKYLEESTMAFGENNALAQEAATRYGTTESQLALMKNQIRLASIEIGTAMLPMVRDLAAFIGGLAKKFNELSPEQKEFISKVVVGGLVVGGLTMAIGALGLAFTGISAVIGVVMSPFGAVILILANIALAVLNLKKAWDKNWNGIRDKTLEVIEKVKGWWEGLKEFFRNPITATVEYVKKGVSSLVSQGKALREKKVSGNAFGSGRISRNDELRRLHEGEKVLTKREADRYEKGVGNSGGIVINVNGMTVREEADIDRIANAFIRKLGQSRITTVGGIG